MSQGYAKTLLSQYKLKDLGKFNSGPTVSLSFRTAVTDIVELLINFKFRLSVN